MLDYRKLTEVELIKAAQEGDKDALEFLIKIYRGLLYFICEKYFLKDGEKDDLVQEATIGFIEAVKAYKFEDKGKKFKNFAMLCIKREIDSCIKRSNRKKHQILNDAIPIYSYAESEDERTGGGYQTCVDKFLKDDNLTPEAIILEKERIDELMVMVNSSLTDLEKQVLRLRVKGHSYNEITLKLNLQNKSVDNAVQRIRKKISSIGEDIVRTA